MRKRRCLLIDSRVLVELDFHDDSLLLLSRLLVLLFCLLEQSELAWPRQGLRGFAGFRRAFEGDLVEERGILSSIPPLFSL